MPLLALVDGVRTVSTLLEDEGWVLLQGDVKAWRRGVRMIPCGLPGHVRTSKNGLRHFSHNAGGGDCGEHTGESPLHLAAKAEILLGAIDAGWEAEPEQCGDGYVANVMAWRETVRVAFEVQASQQVESEYRRRQDRYDAAGVRCAWFAKHVSSVPPPRRDLPIFYLVAGETGALTVRIGDRDLPLREAAAALLSGRMAFRDYVAGPEPGVTDVHAYGAECYKCALTFYVWDVKGSCVTGACGLVKCALPIGDGGLFSTSRPENLSTVIRAVAQAASGKAHPVASIQLRSTAMSGTRYQAFCCPRCGAVYGDFFLRDLIMNAGYDVPDLEIRVPAAVRGIPSPHWCVDVGEGHCFVPPG